MKKYFPLILKGMAMGFAEVIPGVSGGTIAFITGIYERLLGAVKAIDILAIMLIFNGRLKEFWIKIDGRFLLFLFFGMAVGLLSGVFIITYLIKNHIEPLWGFFFGLIVASVIYIARQVTKWNILNIILLIVGVLFAYFLVAMHPMNGSKEYWYIFISGLIAISALIMPGISGSFMLLILGMYTIIIPELKNLITTGDFNSLSILIVFGTGMIVGLFTFARFMSWAFKNFHQQTLVLLTGFMLGSLYKIWPWRLPVEWLNKQDGMLYQGLDKFSQLNHEDIKVISERLVLPKDYIINNPNTFLVILSMILGFVLVFLLDRNQKKSSI